MGSQINLFRKASSGRPLKIFWGSDTWAKLTRRRRGWVKNVLSRKNSPHKSAVGRGVWKTSGLRAENEECVMAEEGDREITILDMQVRMWIWDLISRAMNTLKDNDQGMVHSDLNYEKITQAVVIHLVHHWLLAQNKQVFNSFVFSSRGYGRGEMISENLLFKILVIELSSDVISPNIMSLTKRIEHPKLPRAKKTLAWIHFSMSCGDQGPLGVIMSSNSISTFKKLF